jgi:hypothetical protein
MHGGWVKELGVQGLTLGVDRVLHFVTFIIACVETSQRNSAKTVIYMPGTLYQVPQYVQPSVLYSPAPPQQVYMPAYRDEGLTFDNTQVSSKGP